MEKTQSMTYGSPEWYAMEKEVEAEENRRFWGKAIFYLIMIVVVIFLNLVGYYFILKPRLQLETTGIILP